MESGWRRRWRRGEAAWRSPFRGALCTLAQRYRWHRNTVIGMSDRYTTFANSTPGRAIVKRFGLPSPPVLRRYQPGDPPIMGPVILGGAGRARDAIASVLAKAGVDLADQETGGEVAALVYDGSDLTEIDQLRDLYRFFHPLARSLHACGRVVVLGTPVD